MTRRKITNQFSSDCTCGSITKSEVRYHDDDIGDFFSIFNHSDDSSNIDDRLFWTFFFLNYTQLMITILHSSICFLHGPNSCAYPAMLDAKKSVFYWNFGLRNIGRPPNLSSNSIVVLFGRFCNLWVYSFASLDSIFWTDLIPSISADTSDFLFSSRGGTLS